MKYILKTVPKFFVLLLCIIFIPKVHATEGDRYKCTYYANITKNDATIQVDLLNVYWEENQFGKLETYRQGTEKTAGYEILTNNYNLTVSNAKFIAMTTNSLCPEYCIVLSNNSINFQTNTENDHVACAKKFVFSKSPVLLSTAEQRKNESQSKVEPNDNDTDNNEITEVEELLLKDTVTCGMINSFALPAILPKVTSLVYNLLKVAVPVILIIKGMLDMFKAMSSQKEDEMKKAQKKFVQRLIAGGCALLVFIIVEVIINFIADKTNNSGALSCVNCFINNDCNAKIECSSGYALDGNTCRKILRLAPNNINGYYCDGKNEKLVGSLCVEK